jgi:TolB protein
MGATGESVRRVSEFGYNPTWSPDGREVAFATEEITNFRSRYSHSELWIADVATGAMRRIDCGDAVQPAWSPDGDRIAYWGVRGGQRDLYTVAVTDGEPIAVTEDAFMDWSPAWSPDGGYLYFLSDRGGTMNLWRVRIDQASGRGASEPEPITVPTRQAAQLSISRATGHIAYVDTSETWNIQRVRFDAASEAVGEPEWLTRGDNVLSAPFPSPDGKWLSYFSSLPHDDIVVMRLDGSEVRQLTNDLAKDRCPSWSPDSDRIAFYSNRSGRTEVWTVQLDGRGLAQLTRTDEWVGSEGVFVYPLWSPDGARMSVYGVGCASAILELDDNEQAIEHRPLPRLPKTNDSFQPTSWASSGEKLAGHARLSSGAAMGVWIYSIREKSYMNLTDGGEFPRWLADDRRLIYRHDDRLLLVDSTTGAQRELLSFSSGSIGSRFQVSADNRWIYFTRSESESNIWLVEVH